MYLIIKHQKDKFTDEVVDEMTEPLTKQLFNLREYRLRRVTFAFCCVTFIWNFLTWVLHVIDWRALANVIFGIF